MCDKKCFVKQYQLKAGDQFKHEKVKVETFKGCELVDFEGKNFNFQGVPMDLSCDLRETFCVVSLKNFLVTNILTYLLPRQTEL